MWLLERLHPNILDAYVHELEGTNRLSQYVYVSFLWSHFVDEHEGTKQDEIS
jgi:hypothetical protein